jgi:hypothetical protein
MEEELNYLSEKINDFKYDSEYNEREANRAENVEDRLHHNMMAQKINTEIDLLENILTCVTNYALT